MDAACDVDVSLQAILSDASFCSLVENYILKMKEQSKELHELSEGLFELLIHKKMVNVKMEVLNPASFDYGEPPSEPVTLL